MNAVRRYGETLRETLNADRRRRFGERNRMLALVCECGDRRCARTVVLSVEEYDAKRPDLILHPEHARDGAGPRLP